MMIESRPFQYKQGLNKCQRSAFTSGHTAARALREQRTLCTMASAQVVASALLKDASSCEAAQDLHEAIAKFEQVGG